MTHEEFTKINQELLDLRSKIINTQDEIHEHKLGIELWDAEEIISICDKIDKLTNKPVYGNEERRKAELILRKNASNERQKLDKFLAKLIKELNEMKAQEEFLENDIKWILLGG